MEEKKEWVDFKAVKAAVSMQMVLDRYEVKGLRKSGDELRGPCPIHEAKDTARSFTANLSKNNFHCFSCGSRGNILDFVAAMEECSVKEAALKLADWFKVGESRQPEAVLPARNGRPVVRSGIYRDGKGDIFEVVIASALASDLEEMVVYRELFGDYRYWVASLEAFCLAQAVGKPQFILIKAL